MKHIFAIILVSLQFTCRGESHKGDLQRLLRSKHWISLHDKAVTSFEQDTLILEGMPQVSADRAFVVFFHHVRRRVFAREYMDGLRGRINDPSRSFLEQWIVRRKKGEFILTRKDKEKKVYCVYVVYIKDKSATEVMLVKIRQVM